MNTKNIRFKPAPSLRHGYNGLSLCSWPEPPSARGQHPPSLCLVSLASRVPALQPPGLLKLKNREHDGKLVSLLPLLPKCGAALPCSMCTS